MRLPTNGLTHLPRPDPPPQNQEPDLDDLQGKLYCVVEPQTGLQFLLSPYLSKGASHLPSGVSASLSLHGWSAAVKEIHEGRQGDAEDIQEEAIARHKF